MQTIVLSHLTDPIFVDTLTNSLENRSPVQIIKLTEQPCGYPEISAHPDIFLCPLPQHLVAAPVLASTFELLSINLPVRFGQYDPGNRYPQSSRYNALVLGHFFLHNLHHTDPKLLAAARQNHLTLLPVKQGYARCGAVPVGDHSLITADHGIAAAAERAGIDVLHIRVGFVQLPGFSYGFLGGASGQIGDEIWFHGDLTGHPDCDKIIPFIKKRGFQPRWTPEFPLTDIGSILTM